MKNTKIQEIENFVNGLEQSYLSEHQMMTLTVNPEEVVGGAEVAGNTKCTNKVSGCGHSTNTQVCTNKNQKCGDSTNTGIRCVNK